VTRKTEWEDLEAAKFQVNMGALLLESREPDSTETEAMAEGLPLVGVSVDFQDNEEGTIQVMVGVESNDHFTHTVIEPTFIWRYQSASGADEAIEIESAAGPTTLVRL
jgi:hypothetical protein